VGKPTYLQLRDAFKREGRIDKEVFVKEVEELVKRDKKVRKKLEELLKLPDITILQLLDRLTDLGIQQLDYQIRLYEPTLNTLPEDLPANLFLMWLQAMYACRDVMKSLKESLKDFTLNYYTDFLKLMSVDRSLAQYKQLRMRSDILKKIAIFKMFQNKYFDLIVQLMQIALRIDYQEEKLSKMSQRDIEKEIEVLSEDIIKLQQISVSKGLFKLEAIATDFQEFFHKVVA
jgi:hypothetical protein